MDSSEPIYCSAVVEFCSNGGGWLSLWGGMSGALAAVLLAIFFEGLIRRRSQSRDRARLVVAVARMRMAFAPLLKLKPSDDGRNILPEAASLAQAIAVEARAALRWARERPDLVNFPAFISVVTCAEILENWLESYSRQAAGGREPFFTNTVDTQSLARLARQLDPHLVKLERELRS